MPTFPFWRSPKSPKSPTFPKTEDFSKINDFPVFLQKVMEVAESDEERDLLLLGTLTVLSACLGKVYGFYDRRKVFSNLFLFINARASAGKGLMMLLIPANTSTTGFFQLLYDNHGKGLLFETEGDTLSHTFKTDYENYSDGFRKAFHHETISYFRRTDLEYVDIGTPRVSAVLSGTPKQVPNLIHSSENGLFSRFMFYFMNVNPVWKDVFAWHGEGDLDTYFENLGLEFFRFYERLQDSPEIPFSLTQEQKQRFNDFFVDLHEKYLFLLGLVFLATIRRLGLIFFRICMVLTALRIPEKGQPGTKMKCDERDFEIAAAMIQVLIRVLIRHSARVFSELPEETKPILRKNLKEEFLEALPLEFRRHSCFELAGKLAINKRNATNYMKCFEEKGFVHRLQRDSYQRIIQVDEPGKWRNSEKGVTVITVFFYYCYFSVQKRKGEVRKQEAENLFWTQFIRGSAFRERNDKWMLQGQSGETIPNSVKTQVWIAICTYLLIAYNKKNLNSELTFYEITQILEISVFDKAPLNELLTSFSKSHKI
jgi:hypothetical protein